MQTPPSAASVSPREILLSTGGALIALLVTVMTARLLLEPTAQPFLVASMGATAVLLYAAPASPMAQPWAVFAGHLVSALIGASCARYIPDTAWAAACAGSGAILAMYLLRCMHPPGGATALMPIAASSVGDLGYSYVLAPVGIDVLLMLGLALLINHYLLKRPYPARRVSELQQLAQQGLSRAPQPIRPPFHEHDLQLALQQMDTYIDVTHEDLLRIYSLSRMNAYVRKAGDRRCDEFMQPAGATLSYGQPLSEALRSLNQADALALPVLDNTGRVVGAMGLGDLNHHAAQQPGEDHAERLATLIEPSGSIHSSKPEAVGQVMPAASVLARTDQPVKDILPQLAEQPPAVIPVLDDDGKLAGVLDPERLMAQLHRLPADNQAD